MLDGILPFGQLAAYLIEECLKDVSSIGYWPSIVAGNCEQDVRQPISLLREPLLVCTHGELDSQLPRLGEKASFFVALRIAAMLPL